MNSVWWFEGSSRTRDLNASILSSPQLKHHRDLINEPAFWLPRIYRRFLIDDDFSSSTDVYMLRVIHENNKLGFNEKSAKGSALAQLKIHLGRKKFLPKVFFNQSAITAC